MPIGNLTGKPGYLVRRLRQIAVAIFTDRAGAFGVTTQQYTVLEALSDAPSLEQYQLCTALHLDRSTIATLLVRLEEKGLVRRTMARDDRRRRNVTLTAAGERLVVAMRPALKKVQDDLLAPLAPAERETFRRLLCKLVDHHTAIAEQSHDRAS
jgi:DNA-binding MarR family transcriptional regulator